MKRANGLWLSILLVAGITMTATGDDWPQWRGPRANGVADAGDYPTAFGPDENVAWKVRLPGLGASTPAVWDDAIFVTCAIDGHDGVVCYNLAGEEQWRQPFGVEREGKHRNATGSNPSPVTDGQQLVVYYKSGTVACLDLAGNVQWQTNLQDRYGEDTLWWDLGTSPVLAGGNAVVAVLQEGDSFLVALDLESGEVVWKQDRNYETAVESDHSYATPQVVKVDGREVIVTWGADHLTGHDARSGELLWQCGGFNPENQPNWRVIGSAVLDDEVAVVSSGRGEFLTAVRLDGRGDVTDSHRIWERQGVGADVPTPVIHGDKLYVLTDKGAIVCLEKTTGNEIWSDEFPRGRDKYFASPLLAGNKIYCARLDGTVMIGEISDGLTVVAENDMGEPIIASPVPINGGLLIRGEEHLFRIGK